MLLCLIVLVLCAAVGPLARADVIPPDPDTHLTIEGLIRSRGFEVELHEVVTEDGYILTMHRIVDVHNNNNNNNVNLTRRPVILQHGLMGSAIDFLLNSPFLRGPNGTLGDTLGFTLHLTDRYDVWLANSRGNEYSQRHRAYTKDELAFWLFSYDHMAEFDLPAMIDYVRGHTGFKTVGYVGYSQGTTSMFAMLSIRPHYAHIVQPFVALAPALFFRHTRSPMKYYAPMEWQFKVPGGRYEPKNVWLEEMHNLYCREAPTVCANSLFLIGGFDYARLNLSRIPVYMAHEPSATSMWVFGHYGQAINTGHFNRFDYGVAGNMLKYGSMLAPDWPLERIPRDAKIAIFHGRNDWLATTEDIDHLRRVLHANGLDFVEDFEVADKNWSHTDFAFAEGAGELVFRRVIEVLDTHTKVDKD